MKNKYIIVFVIIAVIAVTAGIHYLAKNETDLGVVPTLHPSSSSLNTLADMNNASSSDTTDNTPTPDLSTYKQTDITMAGGTLHAYIADNETTMEQGLGGQTSLPDKTGMLFVFGTPGSYGFWMKDMKMPLTMIWLGDRKNVIGLTKNISPDTYATQETFYPPANVRYVIEVAPDTVDKLRIATGTEVKFVI